MNTQVNTSMSAEALPLPMVRELTVTVLRDDQTCRFIAEHDWCMGVTKLALTDNAPISTHTVFTGVYAAPQIAYLINHDSEGEPRLSVFTSLNELKVWAGY